MAELTKSTSVSIDARATLTATLTSSCSLGAPIQGNMRQLALDRWNFMYPS